MKKIVTTVTALCFLAACQPNSGGTPLLSKTELGTIVGGAAGAAIGSQVGSGSGTTIATAAATLFGAALGRSIGQKMDGSDLNYYHQTSQEAMETGRPGQPFPWENPQSGVSGTVVPSTYYQNSSGNYCREYTQTVNVGGSMQEGHGVACRQADGSWKIQS